MVYLQITYELCFGEVYFEYFESCDFSLQKYMYYKYRCIHVYVWFKDDKHVVWMWIWLILKNISLLTEYEVCDSFAFLSSGWYFQSIHIDGIYLQTHSVLNNIYTSLNLKSVTVGMIWLQKIQINHKN